MHSTRFATAILQLSILQGAVTCTVENASGIPRRQTKSAALSPSLISIISGALLIVGVGVVYVCHMVCIKRTVKRTIHDSSQTDGKKELDERHKMLAEHKRQRADKLKRQGEKAVHDIEQMEEEIKRQAALGRRPNTELSQLEAEHTVEVTRVEMEHELQDKHRKIQDRLKKKMRLKHQEHVG